MSARHALNDEPEPPPTPTDRPGGQKPAAPGPSRRALTPAGWLPAPVARRNALCLALANGVAAIALGFTEPGQSPALAFLASLIPLPVWACGFAAASLLLLFKKHLAGHTAAVVVWVMLAGGVVNGLVTGSTKSPAASLLLAGAVLAIMGLHLNGMSFRKGEARGQARS